MDTLPLPPRPDIDQYRKRAKALVVAANAGGANSIRTWASDWLTALTRALGWEITPFIQSSFDRAVDHLAGEAEKRVTDAHGRGARFTLADAQHLIARAHSFDTWTAFATHVRGLAAIDPKHADFEAAADAIVNGDLAALDRLLSKNPALVHARSHRSHHATLLHYVAANGVEDFRQKTPPNAVEIATRLLDAGASVDALADTYSRDQYQTTMNLLVSSTHPADAGLQSVLVDVLLDRGAAIDGPADDSSPLMTALAFGYTTAAETLVRRGAKITNVAIAASLGRLDLVREWVINRNTLSHQSPLKVPYWVNIPPDAPGQIARSLVVACRFSRPEVARFLLDIGVDPAAADQDRMTALHWASARGLLEIMDLLIAKGAPLEVRNAWGGTVLDSTVWFAVNDPSPDVDYARVIERLLVAGADPREVHPSITGIPSIDDVMNLHRPTSRGGTS